MPRRNPSDRCRRRDVLAVCAGVVGLCGCLTAPTFPEADIVAGPDGDDRFDPPQLTVSPGETVEWGFASSGHNVSCRPEDSSTIQLPDGANPFASFDPDASPFSSYVAQGETFSERLDRAGRYVYVCVPHVNRGMIGSIEVV